MHIVFYYIKSDQDNIQHNIKYNTTEWEKDMDSLVFILHSSLTYNKHNYNILNKTTLQNTMI